MKELEKYISPFTERLFPEFYREEGQMFISFVKAYYEWLESENQIYYHARRLPDYRDIDKVIEDFIVFFKQKYLSNIQFTTASNKQLFIKNSLDFYRSKGTPRAIDLFFKLIHGLEAQVYYPSDDLFRLSDNEWVDVQYLEVVESPTNIQMVGEIIRGNKTGAEAYVERLVKVKKDTRFISVLYLANVTETNFKTGEQVSTLFKDTNVTTKIVGSLSKFSINRSDSGFELGETTYVEDGAGKKGIGRITDVTSYVGVIDFELLDGGWGYTANAEIIGSDRVLITRDYTIEGVTGSFYPDGNDFLYRRTPVMQFENVKQDLLSVDYDATVADPEEFSIGETVTSYDVGNNITFTGTIVSSTYEAGDTEGTIVVNYSSNTYSAGNLGDEIYLTGNTFVSNVVSSTSVSASANVIGYSNTATITYDSSGGVLNAGDILEQYYTINTDAGGNYRKLFANCTVSKAYSNIELGESYADIVYGVGCIRTDYPLERERDGVSFPAIGAGNFSNTNLGIINIVNTFYNGSCYVQDALGNPVETSFNITTISGFETEANFEIVGYNEEVIIPESFNDTLISAIPESTIIGSNLYQVNNNFDRGFNDTLVQTLGPWEDITIGSIEGIVSRNPGRGYAADPFFIIYEPRMYHIEKYDFFAEYELPPGSTQGLNFNIGEALIGQTSGTRGRLRVHDRENLTLKITRLDLDNNFIPGEIVTSEDTNFSATIIEGPPEYYNGTYVERREQRTGLNAIVKSEAFTGDGFATAVEVVDSGFGYFEEEDLTLVSSDDSSKTISVTGYLGKQGVGIGYHTNRRSFLSSDKYLQDNDFYQEYSYKVLTALPFDAYKDTLIKVLHVAGTKPFGGYLATTDVKLDILSSSESIDFELKSTVALLNENIFYSPTIIISASQDVIFEDEDVFFSPTVRNQILEQQYTFIDADDFVTYPHVISNA